MLASGSGCQPAAKEEKKLASMVVTRPTMYMFMCYKKVKGLERIDLKTKKRVLKISIRCCITAVWGETAELALEELCSYNLCYKCCRSSRRSESTCRNSWKARYK